MEQPIFEEIIDKHTFIEIINVVLQYGVSEVNDIKIEGDDARVITFNGGEKTKHILKFEEDSNGYFEWKLIHSIRQ